MPDKCRCVDFQILKLQEAPEDVPNGEMPRHMTLYCDRSVGKCHITWLSTVTGQWGNATSHDPLLWQVSGEMPRHMTLYCDRSVGKCHITWLYCDRSVGECHVTWPSTVTSQWGNATSHDTLLWQVSGEMPRHMTLYCDRSVGKCHVTWPSTVTGQWGNATSHDPLLWQVSGETESWGFYCCSLWCNANCWFPVISCWMISMMFKFWFPWNQGGGGVCRIFLWALQSNVWQTTWRKVPACDECWAFQ